METAMDGDSGSGPTRDDGSTNGDPAERIWASNGWGPPLSWPALSPSGEPLVFSLRLPLGWSNEAIRPSAETTKPSAGHAPESGPFASLGAWSKLSEVITAQRLKLVLERPGKPDFPLLAALVATVGAVEGAPDPAQGTPARTLSGLRGRRMRTVRELGAGGEGGAPAVSMLVVQYLLRSRYGGLAVSFSAPQRLFHDKLERIFDQVAETIELRPA
jgi:hypothetical protein